MLKAAGWSVAIILALLARPVLAMEELADEKLSAVSGAGIGFFLDNFLYDQGTATAQIGGLKNSSGNPVTIDLSRGYIKGEGSNNGLLDQVASIGSPAHPFTLGVVSGAKAPTLPAGKQALQLKTPTYTDPLNDTRQYGLWAYYQGCVYGEAGCTAANNAVTSISAENTALRVSRDALLSLYQSTGFLTLKSGIDADKLVVEQRQVTVNTEVAQVQVANVSMTAAYQNVPATYLFYSKPPLGRKYDCGLCWWPTPESITTYNAKVDSWSAELGQLSSAQQSLSEAWAVQRNGVTLMKRYTDYDAFVALCGVPTAEVPSCTDGSVADGEANKLVVTDVASALNAGGGRVKGLDLGLETKFSVPSVAYDGPEKGTTTNRIDFFNLYVRGLTLHGSYLNVWGDGTTGLQAEASLQFYINKVAVDGCMPGNCSESNRLVAQNIYFDINMGQATYQPLNFKMDNRGEVNLSLPAVTWANHVGFYQNVPKSNIAVGNLSFANGAGPRVDVGAQIVQGMRLDYFEFTSASLPR